MAGTGRRRWMIVNRAEATRRGEQDPAYEPAHPLSPLGQRPPALGSRPGRGLVAASVTCAYRTRFAPYQNLMTGYSANPLACQRGATTAASRAATLSSLNFVRSLAGLSPVSFSSSLNSQAQQTAVLMAANSRLSH